MRSSLFILSSIDNEDCDIIGPASSLLTNLKIVTPVFLSPLSKACSTGVAPLQRGNNDK